MKETIHYTIQFFSRWHCGSGLTAGANADSIVIRDSDGLPYIPGKTIKGLFRQAVEELSFYMSTSPDIAHLFGIESAQNADTFFSDAILIDHDAIVSNCLTHYLFSYVSQTRIGPSGVAESGSLRRMETVVPCTLKGFISNVDENQKEYFIEAASYIKAIGLNRNRGLGRCKISIIEKN